MNWLINAIWYLPAGALSFGLFYLIWFLLLWAFRVRSKWARVASLPVFAGLVFALWTYGTRATPTYVEAFGFPASPDVSELKSERFLVGQSGGVYLRFRADFATVERIIGRGLLRMDTNHLLLLTKDLRGGHPPDWWGVQALGSGSQFYCATATNRGSFDSVFEYLAYDPSTRLVLFKRDDVD